MPPALIKIVAERQIKAPPQDVYSVVVDIPAWPRFIRGIDRLKLLTDGPITVGASFRETRAILGRTTTGNFKVMLLDPPHRLVFSGQSRGVRIVSTGEFLPSRTGTRLRLVFEGEPLTLSAQMLAASAPILVGRVRAQMQKDLEDIAIEVARRRGDRRQKPRLVDPSDRTPSPAV